MKYAFQSATDRAPCRTAGGTLNVWTFKCRVAALVLMLALICNVRGQGTVNFSNLGLNAPVLDVDAVTRLAPPYAAQLYWGFSPAAGGFMTAGFPSGFLTANPGHWNGGTVTIPGAAPGQIVYVQVRAWNNALFPSFEGADLAGAPVGASLSFAVTLGGGVTPPTTLFGLQSFSLASPPPPPTAVTAPASDITTNSAVLNGMVNPNGFSTSGYFAYGLTSAYGSTTPVINVGDGTNSVSISATATGLLAGTTYHYRVVASNSAGVVTGEDISFTTLNSTTITITPVADTGLVQDAPDNNLGAQPFVPVGRVATNARRGLFRFDLSQIPTNATVESATLTFTLTNVAPLHMMSLHRMLQPWPEGTKSGPLVGSLATNNEATWNHRVTFTTPWGQPGGQPDVDFASTATAVGFSGSTITISEAPLVSDLQAFVSSPEQNFGWMLKLRTEIGSTVSMDVATREDPSRAPTLVVSYAVPPLFPNIQISPDQGLAGSFVNVTGTIAPGAAGVRILWDDGNTVRGLAEGPVDAMGNYSLTVQVPRDAQPGTARIGALKLHSNETGIAWATFGIAPAKPASISGRVTDKFGVALPGVAVRLLDTETLCVVEATADEEGVFSIGGIPARNYIFDVPLSKYLPREVKALPGEDILLEAIEPVETSLPVIPLIAGAIAVPGGSYDAPESARVGDSGASPFARLVSIKRVPSLPPVAVRFWFDAKRGGLPEDTPLAVVFQILKDGTEIVSHMAGEPTPVTCNFSAYTADFNSLEFEPGNLELRITAVAGDPNPQTIGEWRFTVHTTDLAGRWFAGNADVKEFTVTNHDARTLRYQFAATLPSSPVSFDEPIDLRVIQLQNKLALGIPIEEQFLSSGAWNGNARAEAKLTLLSIPFFDRSAQDRSAQYNGPSGSSLPVSTYTNYFGVNKEVCVGIPGLSFDKRKCIKFCVVGCKKCVGLRAGAFICVGGGVDFNSTIKRNLVVTATATPNVRVSADIRVELSALVCNLSAKVKGQALASLPIHYDPEQCPDCVRFLNPCLEITAALHYKVRCFGRTFFKGKKKFFNKQFGNCPAGRASAAGADDDDPDEEPDPDDDDLHLSQPSIAASAVGTSMAVWLPEVSEIPPGESGEKPYYSFFNGSVWTDPAPIYPGNEMGEQPKVVFLDNTRALAVWIHASFLPENEELTDDEQAAVLQNFELRYAIWNGAAWSEPVFLTEDEVYDGHPVLAANPVSGAAMLVWLRGVENVLDEQDFNLALYYSIYSGDVWSAPQRLDPASSTLDFQPSARFDCQGNPGVAWLRDTDSEFGTGEDRQMMFRRMENGVWSAPEVVGNVPPGPWSPSLDFDLQRRPVIAFVVPSGVDAETGNLLGGDGNFSRLTVATKRAGEWQAAVVGENVFAERPVVRVNGDNQAIVMFRRFGFEDRPETGDLAAAVADLHAPEPVWTTDYLTDDHRLNWQVAFDIAPCAAEQFLFWQKRTPETGPEVAGENLRTRFPHGVDLAFGEPRVVLSNPDPILSESVGVSAHIKNAGLQTWLGPEFKVSFYDTLPGEGAVPFSEVVINTNSPLVFGDELEIGATYVVSQVEPRTIYVVLDRENAVTELNETNNVASERLTPATAPVGLLAYSDPALLTITLEWTSPEGTEAPNFAVYRRPAEGLDAFEFVGSTYGNTWVDFLAHPGVSYQYQVIALHDGFPSAPVLTQPVSMEPEPFLPELHAPEIAVLFYEERIILSWSAPPEMVLEQTSALNGLETVWEPVGIAPIRSSGMSQVSVLAEESAVFFRLAMR